MSLRRVAGAGASIAELVEHAVAYVEAGGRPTIEEWAELGAEERAALVAAARHVHVERTADLARAVRGEEGLVRAKVDDGEAHNGRVLADVTDALVEQLRAR